MKWTNRQTNTAHHHTLHLFHLLLWIGCCLCLPLSAAAQLPTTASTSRLQDERRLRLERIDVQPPGGAEERVVRSVLALREGDPLRTEDLVQARRDLEQSHLFKSVDVYTERGRALGDVVLKVDAALDHSTRFESGFGFQPYLGWYLNILGVRWNSPWDGGGHLRLAFRIGQRMREVYLDGVRPRLGGSQFDLLIDTGGGSEDWLITSQDALFKQEIDRTRLYFGVRRRVFKGLHASLWTGLSAANPQGRLQGQEGAADGVAGTLVPPSPGQQTYGDVRLDLVADNRSSIEPWRQGSWLGVRLRGSAVEGGSRFWRAAADLHTTLPFGRSNALAFRGRANYAGPATPYHLRWVVGGTGSIRGFRDASLSGPLGARAFWQGTVELRSALVQRHFPPPAVTGVLFLDFGEHWDARGKRVGMSAGAGYGLRVRIPWIHVFAIDVGIPLTDENTGDPFWVHGSLGFTF